MTSRTSKDRREVIFINKAAYAAYADLPKPVREMADAFMTALQNGSTLPAGRCRPLEGSLAGVSEFRIPYDGDAYRCYQFVAYEEVIYILDAGMKKSRRGGEIPKDDRERLERRLVMAHEAYRIDAKRLKDDYAARAASKQPGRFPDRGRR